MANLPSVASWLIALVGALEPAMNPGHLGGRRAEPAIGRLMLLRTNAQEPNAPSGYHAPVSAQARFLDRIPFGSLGRNLSRDTPHPKARETDQSVHLYIAMGRGPCHELSII